MKWEDLISADILVWDHLGLQDELILLSRVSMYQSSGEANVGAYYRVPLCESLDPEENLQTFRTYHYTLLRPHSKRYIHMPKRKAIKKDLIQQRVPHDNPSPRKSRTGTQTGQEPRGRSWCRSREGVLLTGLLLMACSACFLTEPRTTCPGMTPPTMDWALLHQSLIQKMP